MTRLRKPTMAALAGLGALALLATTAVAATDSGAASVTPSVQLAHMGQGPQSGPGYGRYGIPFNAVYGPAAPEGIVLPEILTEDAVLDAVERAGGGPEMVSR